jgi:hypothetical protein
VPPTFAQPVDDLLVRQHRPQRRTPIDQRIVLVRQTVPVLVLADRPRPLRSDLCGDRQFRDRPTDLPLHIKPGVVDDQEDRLRPTKIFLVRRRQRSVPIVTETEHLQLAGEVVDVAIGLNPRVLARLDRVLLGR